MVLILAVEPDARQLANLATVLRARPKTELVIAESAVRALETLEGRVPDVLLTSALLSRQDETVLATWLRNLGPAASHVQELTIPLLATSAPPPKKRRGVLATLRRERAKPATPDGCDPDVFAEQVSGYMDRASAGRPAPTPIEVAPTPVEVAPSEIEVAPTGEVAIASTIGSAIAPSCVEEIAPTPIEVAPVPVEAEPNVELLLLPVGCLTEPAATLADSNPALGPDTEDLLPLVCAVRFAPEPTLELLLLPVGWLPDICGVLSESEPVLAQDTEDLLPLACAYEPQVQPVESLAAAQPVVAQDAELWVPILLDEECEDPEPVVPDDVWVLGPVTGIDDLLDISVPESAIVAAPPAPPLPTPPPSPQPKPKQAAAKKNVAKPQPKPVQDEWGFFDPDQCGFAALLAKLDEITEENDADEDAQNADTTVRLLSY